MIRFIESHKVFNWLLLTEEPQHWTKRDGHHSNCKNHSVPLIFFLWNRNHVEKSTQLKTQNLSVERRCDRKRISHTSQDKYFTQASRRNIGEVNHTGSRVRVNHSQVVESGFDPQTHYVKAGIVYLSKILPLLRTNYSVIHALQIFNRSDIFLLLESCQFQVDISKLAFQVRDIREKNWVSRPLPSWFSGRVDEPSVAAYLPHVLVTHVHMQWVSHPDLQCSVVPPILRRNYNYFLFKEHYILFLIQQCLTHYPSLCCYSKISKSNT